jgi:hypothetical protein
MLLAKLCLWYCEFPEVLSSTKKTFSVRFLGLQMQFSGQPFMTWPSSSPEHYRLKLLFVSHLPVIQTRSSSFSRKGSRQLTQKIFALDGPLTLKLPPILSSFFLTKKKLVDLHHNSIWQQQCSFPCPNPSITFTFSARDITSFPF